MANTYEAIATVTVGSGGAANIEFTSIPATYTDLCIMYSLRDTVAQDVNNILLTINGTSSGYSERSLYGDGSAASSGNRSNVNIALFYCNSASATSNTFNNGSTYIPNYAGSNNKSISTDSVTENNATTAFAGLNGALWSNSAAITSIKFASNGGTWVQYSTATLYGIKKN
jgi:hypothetical protein